MLLSLFTAAVNKKFWAKYHFYQMFITTEFPSVLWHCWLDNKKRIRPVKSWMLVCWWWRLDWSFAQLIVPVVTITSIILSLKLPNPASPWIIAIKMERNGWSQQKEATTDQWWQIITVIHNIHFYLKNNKSAPQSICCEVLTQLGFIATSRLKVW